MVGQFEKAEFLGQIIDIFEDFLEEKGVKIDNPEKLEDPDLRDDPDSTIIYGSDYGELQTRLQEMMEAWDVMEEE